RAEQSTCFDRLSTSRWLDHLAAPPRDLTDHLRTDEIVGWRDERCPMGRTEGPPSASAAPTPITKWSLACGLTIFLLRGLPPASLIPSEATRVEEWARGETGSGGADSRYTGRRSRA